MQLWQNHDKTHLPIPIPVTFHSNTLINHSFKSSECQQLLAATAFSINKLKCNRFKPFKFPPSEPQQLRKTTEFK